MYHRTLPVAVALSGGACLLACAKGESREVPILARPAATGRDPSTPPACERLPTDLAVAKRPYPESVSWSADGSLIAAAIGQSGESSSHVEGADGIVVWSASDGVVRKRYRIQVQNVASAHAGERLAFSSVWESGVIDLRTDCAVRWPRRGPLLAWSSDDRLLYVAGFSGVAAIDPVRGTPIREWWLPDRDVRVVSLDAKKGIVAFGDTLHVVRTANVDLSRIDVLPGSANAIGNARAVAIAPNGMAVASAVVEEISQRYPPNVMPGPSFHHRFFVRILSLPEGRERAVFPGDPEALAFSPDGGSLAIAGDLDTRLIVRDLATGANQVLDDKVSFPRSIAWSWDGALVALADGRGAVRIYDPRNVRAPRALTP